MELFWKAAAGILISVILCIAIREKEISILLVMAVCSMVAVIAVSYIEPILELLWEMESHTTIEDGILQILLKCAGIAFVTELAGMICTDAGNASLGKIMNMLGNSAVLYLSIPIFRALLDILGEILGKL